MMKLTRTLLVCTAMVLAMPTVADTAPGDATVGAITEEQTFSDRLAGLFEELAADDVSDVALIERRIAELWSRSGSDSMDFLLQRGRQAIASEEFDKAVEHLTALVELEPTFAEGWNARATAFFLMQDYWGAVSDIIEVVTLEPRHFGALAGLAVMLERIGAEDAALRAYRAALEINPHLANAARGVERLAPRVDGREI